MQSLAHAQAGRYEQLEALVERSAADERPEAAAHGYQSVKTSIVKNFETLKPILAAHGIACDLEGMEGEFAAIRKAKGASAKLDVMQAPPTQSGGLRLVSGGQ